MTSHQRAAGAGLQQAGEHADRRRLARAVGAEEPEHLAGPHVEGDVIDRGEPAELARELVHVDGRRGHAAGIPPSGDPINAMKASSIVGRTGVTVAPLMPDAASCSESSFASSSGEEAVRSSV